MGIRPAPTAESHDMTPPSTGPARPPRRFWFDPRFGVGIALVVASIAGVVLLVGSVDDTERVWAARGALSPGDVLDPDDLVVREVRLGATTDRYLLEGGADADGLVVTRTIAAGELLPVAALGEADSVRVAPMVIETSGRLPRSVTGGALVDLWSAAPAEDGGYGPPAVLVGSATVVRVLESDGLIVDESAVGVEILVPKARTALVLEAIAGEHSMAVVPVGRPVSDAAER